MDFATWKQKQLDNYKRMQMPAPTDQELQAKYNATQSLKSSLAQSAIQYKADKAKFQQGMEEQRKSLVETGYGKFPESEPAKSPLQEAISRKVDPVEGIGPVSSGEEYAKNLPNNLDSITKSEKPPVTNIKPEKPVTPPQKPAEVKQEANSLMDQFKKNEAIPDNRREEAYKQFSEARTRNEWLDVAQTLAKALAQYGAATSGRAQSGRDMTLPNMPSVDYTGRTATSERELERRIRDFDTDDAAKRDQAKEAKRDEQFEKELAYKKNKDKLELAESSKRDSEKVDWETKMLRQDEIRAAGEERRSEAKSLAGRQQAAQQFEAVYSAMNAPNVDKKARAKYEMQAAELAGKAGIDLGQAEEAGTVPGRFWGTNQDESKRKANLKEQIDAIMSSRKSAGQQQPQPATMQQAPAGRVTIYKDGQPVGTVPQDQVEQAIAQGYTVK